MKEETTGIISNLRRFISNEAITVKIYIYWGIFTLVVFGFFGFLPVTKIFLSNVKLLDEMYESNKKLEKKIDELKIAKEKLDLVGEDANILDEYLPDDFLPQTYMVDMFVLTGDAGYTLGNLNFSKVGENFVDMSLKITGKGDLPSFIEKIESSGRITEIESLRMSIGDKDDNLSVSVRSFIMRK